MIVTLEAVPNQSLSIQLDDIRYDLRFRDLGGAMSVDISIDDVVILQGHRVVGGLPLIPYKYLEGDGGNFIFLTGGDVVYWNQFGITQSLLYIPVSTLAVIRGN